MQMLCPDLVGRGRLRPAVPASFAVAVRGRLRVLGDPARRVVGAAAVLGSGIRRAG